LTAIAARQHRESGSVGFFIFPTREGLMGFIERVLKKEGVSVDFDTGRVL
jgi:hypothetical protein